jgi:hypothetical protein
MFLILHDPFTGRACVDIEPMKHGLVTAALADLVVQRRLGMTDGRVVVVDPQGNEAGDVSELIVESMKGSRGADVTRSWVESLADLVYELVARKLMTDGVVRSQHGGRRVMRRNADRFPAVDLLRASGPRIRLERMLRSPHEMDVAGAVLAAIVHALHLGRALEIDRDRAAVKRSLAAAIDHLPADLRGLVDELSAAVSTIPLDFRRL